MINGAKDFAEYTNRITNGISWLYLAENEIMEERQYFKTSLKLPTTLKVHKVLRTYNEGNVCKMEFTSLLTKQTRFTFSGTVKSLTRTFEGTIIFH